MAIIIGDKPDSDFSDLIGMLEDCHRRIEKFLDVLLTLASQAQGNALSDEHRAAVETSLHYFREAAPKHTADEEESLFPRLRALQHPDANETLSHLHHLHTDHVQARENHRAVDELFVGGQQTAFFLLPSLSASLPCFILCGIRTPGT